MAETEDLGFEQALEELEAIVAELESGELPLDDMLTRFERAMKLKQRCTTMLEKAEARIRELIDEQGRAEPFAVGESDEEET